MKAINKKNQVRKILLMPIEVISHSNFICKYQNKIYSGQSYSSGFDPDMSDFAVGFYEILYKNIIPENHLLTSNGQLINENFDGDTMNSFKYIANQIIEEKNKLGELENNWQKYLLNYYNNYHCLANFWLVPMKVGRTITRYSKGNRRYQDYMDQYLNYLYENWDTLKREEYFDQFTSWQDFVNQHFLYKSYIKENYQVNNYSSSKNPEEIIFRMTKMIEERAESIASSNFCEELYAYFEKCGLI
ncbi:hypothetical protein [Lactobacillus sp. ESL0703]|uniref:hypothetical protein n=1 Tax=Lactobacillus sp. ESL0703 TaxID=2983218 RepID=UPI0023F62A7E|nr:hypothetical protein [Lactobacillus sp. ESL0703]MDF7669340.1 hypothetical protein [Lactobacillus sp. ESL0703]